MLSPGRNAERRGQGVSHCRDSDDITDHHIALLLRAAKHSQLPTLPDVGTALARLAPRKVLAIMVEAIALRCFKLMCENS